MATLKDIKLRIRSVKSTQQITKAMKMVSASKMKRAEDRIKQARPYADKLRQIVGNLAEGLEQDGHPLLAKHGEGKTLILLITTDRGLCGGLNANLNKAVNRLAEHRTKLGEEIEIIAIGKKGHEFFKKLDISISKVVRDQRESDTAKALDEIMRELIQDYEKGAYAKLFIAYNHFKNVISQEQIIQQVLPLEPPQEETKEKAEQMEFLLEPGKTEILNKILPQYIENQAFTALLDNFACEHAARMTAMDGATKNAGEMISSLTLQYNRARQAAITTELTEIISGAQSV